MSFNHQKGIFTEVLRSYLNINLHGSGLEKSWVQFLENHTCVTLSRLVKQSSLVSLEYWKEKYATIISFFISARLDEYEMSTAALGLSSTAL